jgi:hypothetical protein
MFDTSVPDFATSIGELCRLAAVRRKLARGKQQDRNNLRAIRHSIVALTVVLIALLSQATSVAAGCDAPDSDARCWSQFDDFHSVVSVEDGYIAVGHVRKQPGWSMVHISSDGHRGAIVAIPTWRPDATSVQFNRIIALPKGELALIGSFRPKNSTWQAGLVMAVDSGGRLKWVNERIEPNANVLFQSGIFDPPANIIIAVGRKTSGPDPDGACRNWSQSYVQGFSMFSKGTLAAPSFEVGETADGLNNRQAIYDIVSTESPEHYAFVGFKSEPDATPGHCRDRILIGVLSSGVPQWFVKAFALPSRGSGSEDGYAIRNVNPGEYVVAGQSGDLVNGPSFAQAFRLKLNPLTVEGVFQSPNSDLVGASGSARFRAMAQIRDAKHLIFAGSISSSAQGIGNTAFSQVAPVDLNKPEAAVATEEGAADIYAIAASPTGSVLAAGHAIDRNGQWNGWLEFIGRPDLQRALAATPSPTADNQRAVPNHSAPPLFQTLARTGADYQLPDRALIGDSKYYIPAILAGSPEVDVDFSTSSTLTLRARLLTGKGEVDLLLRDGEGHLVDFSNYRNGAPQLLYVTLRPGKYILSLLVEKDASDIEFDLGRASEIDVAPLSKATANLDPQKRDELAAGLAAAGVSQPSEPSIAIGSETLLSLIAAKEAGSKIDSAITAKLPRDLTFK